jgi:hypothetical protein
MVHAGRGKMTDIQLAAQLMGRKGGSSRSPAKLAAIRKNGFQPGHPGRPKIIEKPIQGETVGEKPPDAL